MNIDDLKEQKIMSTEIKKLNLIIKLLSFIVMFVCLVFVIQIFLIAKVCEFHNASIKQTDLEDLKQDVIDIKSKVHFRYFNLTHSLEDIHNVKINTENGRIIR